MPYTLGTAAKATGYTKPTIRKAIDDGKLSATRNGKGHYQIDPTELQRVYGEEMLKVDTNQKADSETLRTYTPEVSTPSQGEIEALKLVIAEKDKTIERLAEDKEKAFEDAAEWRKQAGQIQILLTHEKEAL